MLKGEYAKGNMLRGEYAKGRISYRENMLKEE